MNDECVTRPTGDDECEDEIRARVIDKISKMTVSQLTELITELKGGKIIDGWGSQL